MSERKAKGQRHSAPQSGKTRSKGDVGFNIIIALVILVVLALGGYAVGSEFLGRKANEPQTDTEQANTSQTVAQYAEANGTTADEFLAQYGLSDNEAVTADTNINMAAGYMTVEKFAEFSGTTVEELKEQNGLGDEVTNDMTWTEAQEYVPVGTVAQMQGMEYSEFLAGLGLTEEELPADTIWKEALPILNAAAEKMSAEEPAQADAE